MNLVDVDPTSTQRELVRRNVLHVIVVAGGSLGLIAIIFWLFFGVLLGPYW